jgi:UDP-N-acetylbacillosamine N-acetyltransferase
MNRDIVILGSGGHAAHCVDLLAVLDLGPATSCLDDDPRRHGQMVLGVPVRGMIGDLSNLPEEALVIVAIGDPSVRGRLMALAQQRGLALPSLIHPAASVAASARVGAGCIIDAGAVIGSRAQLGSGVIVDAGASIAHDAWIGGMTHIEAGARVLPGARIGHAATIGAQAVVARGATVGDDALVAVGELVTGTPIICGRRAQSDMHHRTTTGSTR